LFEADVTLPLLPTVRAFIDRINRRDLNGLLALMTDDHCLKVLDEDPSCGKEGLREAWRGYFDALPTYLIYPRQMASTGSTVAILGHTTGSHLGLPDDAQSKLTVIWTAEVRDGLLASWTVLADTPETRATLGLS
jgi:ketosteroid isomerase-like protein